MPVSSKIKKKQKQKTKASTHALENKRGKQKQIHTEPCRVQYHTITRNFRMKLDDMVI